MTNKIKNSKSQLNYLNFIIFFVFDIWALNFFYDSLCSLLK